MKKLLLLCLIYIIPAIASATNLPDKSNNAIKLGKAQLFVDLICFADPEDPEYKSKSLDEIYGPFEIYANTVPLFNKENEVISIPLKRDSMRYYAEVPVERLEEIGGIEFFFNGESVGGCQVVFKQNEPTGLQIELSLSDPSQNYVSYYGASRDYTMEDWRNISHAIVNALSVNPFMFYPKDRSVYKSSWRDVVKIQTDSIWPAFLKKALIDVQIPLHAVDWVTNSLKMRFASQCVIPYVERAKVYDIIVDEPPIEAYDFLGSIDYNPDVFLLAPPLSPQRLFISNIMRFIDGGLEDIGERPVKEWKEYMDRKLAPAMEERPKLLLDLLAGMSYVRQLEEEKPLTPIQIKNINEGFTDDIGKIVLARNEALVARLEKKEKAELRNMTDEAFDLKKFIDENYKGRPVVVDLWNTWCGPCMQAISQSEETKQEFAGSDLVFLYVADDSSPEDEWSRKAEEIGSKQVRVSTDTSAAILKSHNLEGFPSYLFFDRDHNLIHSRTAFPGPRGFRELLLELNPRK